MSLKPSLQTVPQTPLYMTSKRPLYVSPLPAILTKQQRTQHFVCLMDIIQTSLDCTSGCVYSACVCLRVCQQYSQFTIATTDFASNLEGGSHSACHNEDQVRWLITSKELKNHVWHFTSGLAHFKVQAAKHGIAYWTYCDTRCSSMSFVGHSGDLWPNGETYRDTTEIV